MIYLRKKQNDQQVTYSQKSDIYLRNDMILFDDYFVSVESALLDNTIEADIKWKLYQLADIYLKTSIIFKWLVIPTDKARIKFFLSFSNQKKLLQYIDFSIFFPTSQLETISRDVSNILKTDFDEAIKDFVAENSEGIKRFQKKYIIYKKKAVSDMEKNISFLLFQGLWAHLRILPKQKVYIDNNQTISLLDFVSSPLVTIDSYQQEDNEIKDTEEFIKKGAIESIQNFIKLANLYFSKFETRSFLEKNHYKFEIKEHEYQFIQLLKNTDFITIKTNCADFCDYCYILITSQVLKYENSNLISVSKKSWGNYFAGEFIHDTRLDLVNHISNIQIPFMRLFNLRTKEDLKEKNKYEPTYTGYQELSTNTLIPRLKQLKNLRK